MTKPSVYHSQGYNCAEALIKSYNEDIKQIFQDKKWTFVGILLVLTTVITLIASIFLPENTCVIIFLIGASIAIMSIFLYPNENKIMLNKYKKYITK